MNARYWLAVDSKKATVLGTTGLYETGADKAEASWLGWMSVPSANIPRPGHRQKTRRLCRRASQDRTANKLFSLYTSNARRRGRSAQHLYTNAKAFKLVHSEPHTIPRVVQRIFGQKESHLQSFGQRKAALSGRPSQG